jgi:hypothetical protein
MRIKCSTLPHTTSTFRDFPPVGLDLATRRAEQTSWKSFAEGVTCGTNTMQLSITICLSSK